MVPDESATVEVDLAQHGGVVLCRILGLFNRMGDLVGVGDGVLQILLIVLKNQGGGSNLSLGPTIGFGKTARHHRAGVPCHTDKQGVGTHLGLLVGGIGCPQAVGVPFGAFLQCLCTQTFVGSD